MSSNAGNVVKVSVIVPVYNTEAYVRDAINSIRFQTMRELEIIIVNDGSTDRSLTVVEELAEHDERIRIYSQENQGPSVSRNLGLQHARGKYIYFMDSDDLLEADALELCYVKCETSDLDFVFFDAAVFHDEKQFDGRLALEYNHTEALGDGVYSGPEALRLQVNDRKFTASPCLSFIRRQLIDDYSLGFMPGIIHEDQLFTTKLYLAAAKTACIRRAFFQRRIRSNSIMTNRFAWKNINGYITVAKELLHFKDSRASNDQRPVIDAFLRQMLDAAVWHAYVFPLFERFNLLLLSFRKEYRPYITNRTRLVMLTKSVFRSQ